MSNGRWNREQLKLAFHLYCQLPFGKMHQRNAEIIELAKLLGRTPSAVAMKLVNFASLDPAIRESGRVGLGNASLLDKEVWDEFNSDWERLAVECVQLKQTLVGVLTVESIADKTSMLDEDYSASDKEVRTLQRVTQSFFRRAVLSSYRGRCCISGLTDARLLVASHIVPWRSDVKNRLNPSNGLCLSAIHDKAFDRGVVSLADDLTVILCDEYLQSKDAFIKQVFAPIHGKQILLPDRFAPKKEFLEHHRNHIFLDAQPT